MYIEASYDCENEQRLFLQNGINSLIIVMKACVFFAVGTVFCFLNKFQLPDCWLEVNSRPECPATSQLDQGFA
jgi:hypothetical protein